jgi:hypothetical protein
MTKFAVGTKVIPFQKTTGYGDGLSASTAWNKAKEVGQPFLYVTGNDYTTLTGDVVTLLNNEQCGSGDFFKEGDYVPYDIQEGGAVEGDKVVFVGKELASDPNQTDIFEYGKTYTVRKAGVCGRGDGVLTEEEGSFVIVHGNYLIVERYNSTLAKLREELDNLKAPVLPDELTANELVTVLKEEDERVKTVNVSELSVYDTYHDLDDLTGVWSSELETCIFMLESDWNEFDDAMEAYNKRKQELIEQIEALEKVEPVEDHIGEVKTAITFAEAVAHVANGGKVEVLDDCMDRMDTYTRPSEFTALTTDEIEEGKWFKI